jgi:choline dehydrogenase
MEPPSMRPNYLDTETDRMCAVESIKYARKLAATEALKPYIESEYKPGTAVQSDHEILEFARESGATIFHPSGTCKMGSDPMAVTDARLRVHGVAGLRVVDCSIMPTLTSGNTHAPTVMVAENSSDMILEDQKMDLKAA